MKSILFIIPSLKTGGTNSSLASLYNCLQEDYKIKVDLPDGIHDIYVTYVSGGGGNKAMVGAIALLSE